MTEQLLIITKAYVKESVNEESFFLLILFSIQGKNVSVFFFLKKVFSFCLIMEKILLIDT